MPRHNSVRLCNQQHGEAADHPICYNSATMFDPFRLWFSSVLCIFRSRRSLMLENLALRQQLAVLKREHPRPRLGPLDKLFWVLALSFWSQWKESLILVLPDTVVRWHQAGFKLYWAMLCKVRKRVGGGRRISKQIRELIFQMVAENPSWGAPRIHGELLMLGLDVSERTISRWMKCAPKDPEPAKRWLAFLRTITFGVLYFSSLPMTAGASYTSTSSSIPRACGSSSSCERRFRLIWLLGFSSSIGMPSTDWKSRQRFDP